MKKKIAAIIDKGQQHYLDHLAPLAVELDVPLLITDQSIFLLAEKYYPDINLIYIKSTEWMSYVVDNIDYIISCLPSPMLNAIFFIQKELFDHKIMNIWCPHGHSDKGHIDNTMFALNQEQHIFVYGDKMIDILKECGSFKQLEDFFFLGNYRYDFFKKHESFYLDIMKKMPFFNNGLKTMIYAPTWDDYNNSTSYNSVHKRLIEYLPSDWNLIIKPHPHLNCELFINKPNIYVLKDFPPIYPLLNQSDVYLGDISSVGYDFLRFFRRMIFYDSLSLSDKEKEKVKIFSCGDVISTEDNPFELLKKPQDCIYRKNQRDLYDRVFKLESCIQRFKDRFVSG